MAPTSKLFSRIKGAGKLLMSDPDAAIDTRIAPLASEPVFVKRRVGAFSSTDLESFLRAKGVDTIVLAGFSTSGVILSTLCWAADRDFRVVVLADLCADCEVFGARAWQIARYWASSEPRGATCGGRQRSQMLAPHSLNGSIRSAALNPSAADKEVHSVLTSKVFAKQAHVMTSAEVLEA